MEIQVIYKSINLRPQQPPPLHGYMGSPWPFELLKISLFRFPLPQKKKKKKIVQMPCPNFFCEEQGQQPRISAQAVTPRP